MKDPEFDRLLSEALTWRADQLVAQQTPKRLAMRQMAVRLSSPAVEVRSRVFGRAGSGQVGARGGRRLVGQLAGVAAVLVVAALVVLYVYGPASQFGATGPVFESARHAYSLRLPTDGWTVREIPGDWPFGEFLDAEGPGSDYYERRPEAPPHVLVYMYMASQPIPSDLSFDGWIYQQDGVTAAVQPCFVLQGDYQHVTVDDETARVGLYYCSNFAGSGVGWATVQVLFSHDGRGYAMYFWPEQEPDMAPFDDVRRATLGWLSSFSFTEPGASPSP